MDAPPPAPFSNSSMTSRDAAAWLPAPAMPNREPPPSLESVGLTEADLDAVRDLFDEVYYVRQYPDLRDAPFDLLRHFMTIGWKQRLNPSPMFSTEFYLRSNPEIGAAGINPLLHYARHGRREKRPAAPYFGLRRQDYRPLVSVVVPNFNHAAYLRERLESIFSQTYRNIELILLDDGSTDGSRETLDELAARSPFPVKKAYSRSNSGNVFAQWRRGFEMAQGELVWICESDDTCEPDALEHLAPHFADRSVMIAFGRIQFCDANGRKFAGLDQYRENAEPGVWAQPIARHASEWFAGAFGRNNVIANVGGCVIRRQNLAQAVWDEARSYEICGDWYLYIQMAAGGRIVFDPNSVAYFRQHGRNTSAANFDKLYYYEEHERILRCLEENWTLRPETRAGFIESLSSSWLSRGMSARHGDMLAALPGLTQSTPRRREHLVMGSLGFMLGGGELFPIYLANEFVRAGYRVSMLCSNLTEINDDILARLDSRVPVFDAAEAKVQGPQGYLNRMGATLIHSHVVNIDDLFFKNHNPLEKFPYVVTLHGSHQGDDLNVDALLFRMLRRVSKWVYLSERNLEIFSGAPLDYSAFRKIPNAAPPDPRPFPLSRRDLGVDRDAVVFAFAARGVQQKGWRATVEALKLLRLRRPELNVHVLMAGSGPIAEEVEASTPKDLPITFLGFQSCINGLYRISDVALAPTRFGGESFPLSIIQALQEGLPVIATRIGEIPSMIAEGKETAGALVDNTRNSPLFFEAVYQAMVNMMDPERRERASALARRLSARFDMGALRREYIEVYEEAMKKVAGRPAAAA